MKITFFLTCSGVIITLSVGTELDTVAKNLEVWVPALEHMKIQDPI